MEAKFQTLSLTTQTVPPLSHKMAAALLSQLRGTFTVNQNLRFNNCTFRFATDSKVNVIGNFSNNVTSNVTFTLDKCKLYALTNAWEGIVLTGIAKINLLDTRIEDAKVAVTANGARISLFSTNFVRNGIAITDGPLQAGTVLFYHLSSPRFLGRCGNATKPGITGQLIGLLLNHSDVTVGKNGATPPIFYDLDLGINPTWLRSPIEG
jgi:hypothetical protein